MAAPLPEQASLGPDTTTVKDALDFLHRRRWLCLGVAGLIILAAVVLAFRLPPVYLSQSTILIEQPAIPEDIVPSIIRRYVDEQIQIVAQRVYMPESVMDMVDKFDLYREERRSEDQSATVARFIESTYLENLTAEVTDSRGRTADSTFAFIVGFHHSDPDVTQKVAAEIAQRFLDENVKSRTERAATTTNFLVQEAERLADEISAMETRLADFKEQYGDALPSQVNLNSDLLNRTDAELARTNQELRELRAQLQIIQSEMTTLDPYATIFSETGEPVFSAEQRLSELRQEYLQLSSRYGPEHPDVVRTKREIEAIVGSGNLASALGDAAQQRAVLEAELERLLDRYSDEHPDVIRVRKALDALPPEGAPGAETVSRPPPNNPAYLAAQARMQSIQSGLAAAEERRRELASRRVRLERALTMAPRVEQEWLQLNRGYESARAEYEEIKRRSTGARLAENLEVQNKGERFTLLQHAGLPVDPVEPNRPAIIFLGIVLALGAGVGLAALIDALDTSIRSPQDLQKALAVKPLVVIPYVRTMRDRRVAWTRRVAATGAAVAVALAVILLA